MAQAAALKTQVLGLRVGSCRLAVAADRVMRVMRMPLVTRVPHGPPALLGLASLHGQALPVVTLHQMLGEVPRAAYPFLVELDARMPVGIGIDAVEGFSDAAIETDEIRITQDGTTRSQGLTPWLKQQFGSRAIAPVQHQAVREDLAQEDERARARQAYVTFRVAGQLVALDLRHVREVLPLPKTAMTSADEATGDHRTMEHRGRTLPLLALDSLLGLPERPRPDRQHVLVTGDGQTATGLIVDALSSIERLDPRSLSPVPAVLNRGGGTAKIRAMTQLSDGRGLLSILAPPRGMDEADAPSAPLADITQPQAKPAMVGEAGERFLLFVLGGETYGLPLDAVEDVVRLPETLTRLPKAPAFIEGIMQIHGQVIPVLDQARRFEARGADGGRRRVVVTRVGDMRIGLIVDQASEIAAIPAEQISPAPPLASGEARVFDRVAPWGERLVLLADPHALLARAEADLLAALMQPGVAA